MTNYLGGLIFASKLNEAPSEHAHMTTREGIAEALKARLSELKSRVAKIESELRTPLSAAAPGRLPSAVDRACTQCGEVIDPKRLRALP